MEKRKSSREDMKHGIDINLEPVELGAPVPAQQVLSPNGPAPPVLSQQVLKPIDPRHLTDDLVFCLMRKGRSLAILDDLRPIFRMHTAVGGHLSGVNQAESYVRPTVIKTQREAMLSLFKKDIEEGSFLSLIFDETTGRSP